MGIINFFKNIFRKKQKKEEKEEKKEEKEEKQIKPVDLIVQRYLKNKYINFPIIPQHIEKFLYTQIVSFILDQCRETIKNSNICIFSRKINFNIEDNVVEKLINSKSSKNMKINEKYVDRIIDEFLGTDSHVHSYSLWPIPSYVEKQIYRNIIFMAQAICIDILQTIQLNIFDKKIKLKIGKLDNIEKKFSEFYHQDEKSKTFILDLVDFYINKNNITWIPDAIEKKLYIKCFSVVDFFVRNILIDSEFYVMHSKIQINIV